MTPKQWLGQGAEGDSVLMGRTDPSAQRRAGGGTLRSRTGPGSGCQAGGKPQAPSFQDAESGHQPQGNWEEPHRTRGELVGSSASEGLVRRQFPAAERPRNPSVPSVVAEPDDWALRRERAPSRSHGTLSRPPPQAPPTGRRTTSAAPRGWAWWSARERPAAGRGSSPRRSSCVACSSETGIPATPWAWTHKPRARIAPGEAEGLLCPVPGPQLPPPAPRLPTCRGSGLRAALLTSPAHV